MGLDFTRRGSITGNNVVGYPKLVRNAKGVEVLFIMEDKNGLPIEMDPSIADGVPCPRDLEIRVIGP